MADDVGNVVNADSSEARRALRQLLSKVVACAVLMTSRYSGDLSGVRRRELALFTAEEAREYLRSHLHAELLAQSSGEGALDAVAREVDHLPLALELVVSYMHETRQSPTEWLEEWREAPTPTIIYHDPDSVNYPVSLARAWDQSVSRISPSARDILHLLAWLAPRPATLPLGPLRQAEDWPHIRAAIVELAKASLVAWPDGTEEISTTAFFRWSPATARKRRSGLFSKLEKLDAVSQLRVDTESVVPLIRIVNDVRNTFLFSGSVLFEGARVKMIPCRCESLRVR